MVTYIVQELWGAQEIIGWEVYRSTPAGLQLIGTFPSKEAAETYRTQLYEAQQRRETD